MYIYIYQIIYIYMIIYTHIYIYIFINTWIDILSSNDLSGKFPHNVEIIRALMWPLLKNSKPLTTFKKPGFSEKYGQLGGGPIVRPFFKSRDIGFWPFERTIFFRSQEWGSTKPRWHDITAGQLGQQDVDWLSRWYSYTYIIT